MYQKIKKLSGCREGLHTKKTTCNALSKIEVHHYILQSCPVGQIGGFASPILAIGSHLWHLFQGGREEGGGVLY